jgi:hypothetical protein
MTSERITLVFDLMAMLTVIAVVHAICATIIIRIVFRGTETDAASMFIRLVEKAGLLQMMVVVLIIISVFVLRLLDIVGADATVSVFSGIAGYVLGGLPRLQLNRSGNEQNLPQPS